MSYVRSTPCVDTLVRKVAFAVSAVALLTNRTSQLENGQVH